MLGQMAFHRFHHGAKGHTLLFQESLGEGSSRVPPFKVQNSKCDNSAFVCDHRVESVALNALGPDSICPFSAARISSARTLRAYQD